MSVFDCAQFTRSKLHKSVVFEAEVCACSNTVFPSWSLWAECKHRLQWWTVAGPQQQDCAKPHSAGIPDQTSVSSLWHVAQCDTSHMSVLSLSAVEKVEYCCDGQPMKIAHTTRVWICLWYFGVVLCFHAHSSDLFRCDRQSEDSPSSAPSLHDPLSKWVLMHHSSNGHLAKSQWGCSG